MPLFSIVMPTRDRGHLLRYSLRSALEQKFDDYEIVVSDNASVDETRKVVDELRTPRVRYFNTGKRLSMSDNWEFALDKAQGEYVAYLSDDDALTSDALAEAHRIISLGQGVQILCWMHATYFSDSHPILRWRNQLAIPNVTEQIHEVESHRTLVQLFGLCADPARIPRMLNGCCRRNVIADVRAHMDRFFLPVAPDFSSCTAMLAVRPRYTYIDKALMIGGASSESIGRSSVQDRSAAAVFFKEYGKNSGFENTPTQVMTLTNAVAESILQVKRRMPQQLEGYELDWAKYFADCYTELKVLLVGQAQIQDEVQQIVRIVNQLPAGTRQRVWRLYARKRFAAGVLKFGQNLARRAPAVRRLHRMVRGRTGETRIVRGDHSGFRNILDCRLLLGRASQGSGAGRPA